MSEALHVVAVTQVAEGKMDRFIELLAGAAKTVKETEPGCLQYEFFKSYNPETKQPDGSVTLVERYVSQAAFDSHAASAHMAAVFAAIGAESLVAAPPAATFSKYTGGFAPR